MKKIVLFALVLTMTACNNKKTAQTSGIYLSNLDTTAVAQDDFYQYACGGWMKNNPLTGEYSRFGSFDKLAEDNREQLNSLISDIAKKKDNKAGSVEQKICPYLSWGRQGRSGDQRSQKDLCGCNAGTYH